MDTHAGSILYNPVTLTFDLLTSESMLAEELPWSICVPSLVLIAEVVFLLGRGHTRAVTDAIEHGPAHLIIG